MGEQSDGTVYELIECQEANQQLKEENAHLREAADAFGGLAERLSAELREDRRRHPPRDRRAIQRHYADRRARLVSADVESA